MPNNQAAEKFADAIVREIPVSQLKAVLGRLNADSVMEAAGSGCGNGCGGNCADSIDEFGYAELSAEDRAAVIRDKDSLREHVIAQLQAVSQKI
ncbi:hypothetical protein ACWD6R_35920 [Streptomyces sp. NPDC005151]